MKDKLLISSYNIFTNLAHKPQGKENLIPLKFITDNISKCIPVKDYYNPAFTLKHPDKNIIYMCCESIFEGNIFTIGYNDEFEFTLLNNVKTGLSTCYIEIDFERNNLLVVNYWDSTINIHPLINDIAQEAIYTVESNYVYNNRPNHLKNRQKESHNHSLLLYKYNESNIAFVPDLGKDQIKIFDYFNNSLKLITYHKLKKGSGPRYIRNINEFLYVINELNSTVEVLQIKTGCFGIYLLNIQTISTLPNDYNGYNTCGNIEIHPSNKYIVCSNRGHDSVAIYEILDNYKLKLISINDCYGKTPRHFSFNKNGSILYIANQDSDNISVFNFNNGNILFNSMIDVNSPNYILQL